MKGNLNKQENLSIPLEWKRFLLWAALLLGPGIILNLLDEEENVREHFGSGNAAEGDRLPYIKRIATNVMDNVRIGKVMFNFLKNILETMTSKQRMICNSLFL